MADLSIEYVPTSSLKPYPKNPRKGSVPLIVESIKAHGQYRPVVVNKRNGQIVAGHHLWYAMKDLNSPTIAVTFIDVDEDQHKRILLMDNRSADVGDYDNDVLVEILQSIENPSVGTGYDEDTVFDILGLSKGKWDKDKFKNPTDNRSQTPSVTQPGDVWLLGKHRLMCGSATSKEDVLTLLNGAIPDIIVADPP